MKKRILTLLLACVLLVLPLAACQSKSGDGSATTAKNEVVPSEGPTEKPTEQPTEKPTEQPTEKPTEAPTDKPTEAPTDKPVDPPTPTASVYSGTADTSWYTGDKKEYVLKSADQLVGFHSLRSDVCTFEGVTIKLDCDVILNEGTLEEIIARGSGNHAWKQLNSAHQFKGTFDGQGHTISGLYMKLTSSAVRGMFGGIGGNAVIKNFTLINAYYGGPTAASKNTLGAVAAKVHSGANVTISDVSVTAVLKEDTQKFTRVGGIIGNVDAAATVTLENCEFNGSISITGNYAGGMIGMISHQDANVNLVNCKNNGDISAAQYAGGMAGMCIANSASVSGCTNTGRITAAYDSGNIFGLQSIMNDPANGARPATPAGKTALRVMSFNLQSSLPKVDGVIGDPALNRIEAVRQEILFYEPDLIGFQEDTLTWHSMLDLSEYNRIIDPTIASTTELCGIYYKKGLKLLSSGTVMITADGTHESVALTVADLTTEGSKYKLSDAHLAELGITKDSPDSVLTESRKYDASTSYVLLGCRKMSWGVFDINGQIVIYINTHLQHRSQTSNYSTDAIQAIRSMERIKSFDILQAKLAEIKENYSNTVDFITGDFNDLVHTAIYNSACIDYGYSSAHQVAAEKYGVNGSWNNAFNINHQGDNYPSDKEGTSGDYLDYCFVSKGIDVLKFRVGAGKAEITAVDGTKKTIYTSDHLPIITDLCFATEKTGSPIDPDYKDEVDDLTKPSVYSGVYDTSWYKEGVTEFTLTTADQLMGMSYLRNKDFTFEGITIKLGRDMIINEGTLEEIVARGSANYAWRALSSTHLFKGTFDGQGHTISGVYHQLSTTGNRSMFGGVGGNATIKNFTLENSYLGGPSATGKKNLAFIVTRVYEEGSDITISDIHIKNVQMDKGSVSMSNVAGFVGNHEKGNLTITNCTFDGDINFDNSSNVAGFVGNAMAGTTMTLDNCVNTGDLSAKNNCGGLVGNVEAGATVTNNNSTSTGTITCPGTQGELIGNQA
ncbi:MAG: PT domain-containing protein [Clostridia bacterium]|nr:PT domain-containing protein [Clostridia bacterium]